MNTNCAHLYNLIWLLCKLIGSHEFERVELLQNLETREMIIILKCDRLLMLSTLEWFSVKYRFFLLSMHLIFQIVFETAPTYFKEFIMFNPQIDSYSTWLANDFHITETNATRSMKSFFHYYLVNFSTLPIQFKNTNSIKQFKH